MGVLVLKLRIRQTLPVDGELLLADFPTWAPVESSSRKEHLLERRDERTVQVFPVEILPNGTSRKGINASHSPHSASRHSVA